MTTPQTSGVMALARLVTRVASGGDVTVASLAAEGGFARSSLFDIVRRLEAAGLVGRDGAGVLRAGPTLVKLGYAGFRAAAAVGPAEALLALLRDEADGTARLMAADGTVLLALGAQWDTGARAAAMLAVHARELTMTLALQPSATRSERGQGQAALDLAAAALVQYADTGD